MATVQTAPQVNDDIWAGLDLSNFPPLPADVMSGENSLTDSFPSMDNGQEQPEQQEKSQKQVENTLPIRKRPVSNLKNYANYLRSEKGHIEVAPENGDDEVVDRHLIRSTKKTGVRMSTRRESKYHPYDSMGSEWNGVPAQVDGNEIEEIHAQHPGTEHVNGVYTPAPSAQGSSAGQVNGSVIEESDSQDSSAKQMNGAYMSAFNKQGSWPEQTNGNGTDASNIQYFGAGQDVHTDQLDPALYQDTGAQQWNGLPVAGTGNDPLATPLTDLEEVSDVQTSMTVQHQHGGVEQHQRALTIEQHGGAHSYQVAQQGNLIYQNGAHHNVAFVRNEYALPIPPAPNMFSQDPAMNLFMSGAGPPTGVQYTPLQPTFLSMTSKSNKPSREELDRLAQELNYRECQLRAWNARFMLTEGAIIQRYDECLQALRVLDCISPDMPKPQRDAIEGEFARLKQEAQSRQQSCYDFWGAWNQVYPFEFKS